MQVNNNKNNNPASGLGSKKRLDAKFNEGKPNPTTSSPKPILSTSEFQKISSGKKLQKPQIRNTKKHTKEKEKQDNNDYWDKIFKDNKREYLSQKRLERKSESSTESENQDPDWFFKTFLVRAKEILVLSSFIVGITFTALIATGILAWGMLPLGIFEAIGFLGASHFFGSFSLAHEYHKCGPNGEKNWGNPLFKDEDYGLISDILSIFKFIVFPLIFLSGGITLIILGNAGMIEFPLSLILGMPSVIASLSALNFWMRKRENRDDEKIRSGWYKFVIVTGILTVATFLILSFTGVFALPVAIGFTLPIIGFDLCCFAMKCIECCIRNSGEIEEENLESPITEQNRYPKNKNVAYDRIPQSVSNKIQDKSKNGQ